MTEEIAKEISWTPELELYFAQTGEKAHCLSYLHKKSEGKYSHYKTMMDLPVIVISSVNGFLAVGSNQIFQGWSYASIVLGMVSLFVSVLNTISSYYSFGKLQEGHRISGIQYNKLYRFLQLEMNLPRDERMSPHDLLKRVQEDFNRLQEISPLIPEALIKSFKNQFSNITNISKPDEANGLEKIMIFKEKQERISLSMSSDGPPGSPNPQREQDKR